MKANLVLHDCSDDGTDVIVSVGDVVEVLHSDYGFVIGRVIEFSDSELTLFTASGISFFMGFSSIFLIEKVV